MGRLQRIEGTINSTISGFSHVKAFPRGLLRFIDPLLRGSIRFAKRTGNTISVINPDNTFKLAAFPQQRDTSIVLASTSSWMTEDVLVSIGPGKELHEVYDVVDNTLILKDAIKQNYGEGTRVLLFAYPMLIGNDALPGSTQITVKSHYRLANGDVFGYLQTEDLLQSFTEIRATEAQHIGQTTDPFYTELYVLTLEKPVGRFLFSNTKVYIRAYPAYFASAIRIPSALFTSEPQGPFLIDLLSGNLLEGKTFRETLSIRALNRTGGFVVGTSTTYQTVTPNYLVFSRPLAAQFPMFWDLAEGSMRLTPGRVVFKVNSEAKFVVGFRCVPEVQPPGKWRISVRANEDCSMRFIFHPNAPQEFNLNSGQNTVITVDFPIGSEPCTQMEINVLGTSEICQIQVSDWTPVIDTIEQIEYSLMVEAVGEATYQASGMIIKPYFLGPELLRTTWDTDSNFDSGKIYF